MPRAGLTTAGVVAAALALADEVGFHDVTMGLLAERLGVRTPSLYKHVAGLADLQHQLATLVTSQVADESGAAVQGLAGRDALAALARTMRAYVVAHPGGYTATVGAEVAGDDDPLELAARRWAGSLAAVLRGYGISDEAMPHAMRSVRSTLHGFAVLQASNGFQWAVDLDDSFDWMIEFLDKGLRAAAG